MGQGSSVNDIRNARRRILDGRRLLASTALLALPFAASAQDSAQDTTLQPIVVQSDAGGRGATKGIVAKTAMSGAKTNTSLRETPQAVSVITRDQMTEQGANTVSEEESSPVTRDFSLDAPTRARYLRVHVVRYGKLPAWHPGAGNEAWFFADDDHWLFAFVNIWIVVFR